MKNVNNFKEHKSFNIVGGVSYSIKEIYSTIESILGKNDGDIDVEFLESDLSEVLVDISKANNLLNWKPKFDLKKGLSKTIDYYSKKIRIIKKYE